MSAANNISLRSFKEADNENVAFRAAILYCHQRYNLKGSVDGDNGSYFGMGASERGNYVWCLVIVVILMALGRAAMWGRGEL